MERSGSIRARPLREILEKQLKPSVGHNCKAKDRAQPRQERVPRQLGAGTVLNPRDPKNRLRISPAGESQIFDQILTVKSSVTGWGDGSVSKACHANVRTKFRYPKPT